MKSMILFIYMLFFYSPAKASAEVSKECAKKITDGVYNRFVEVMNRGSLLYERPNPHISNPKIEVRLVQSVEFGDRYEVSFAANVRTPKSDRIPAKNELRTVHATFASYCETLGNYSIFLLEKMSK